MRRHSIGMMAAGITMLSLAPISALVSLIAAAQKGACNLGDAALNDIEFDNKCDEYDPTIYGFAIGSVVLIGVGIPLTIVGAKSEQVPPGEEATLSPWISREGAGTTLRLHW
jgi:hypothetical protein